MDARTIELLAPARDLQSAVAAIDYGADAVYMGAPKFGARHAAGNTLEDISRAVEYARRYGARVYATLNTILYDNELEEAHRQALEVIAAGADALIIQDMAYMEMGLTGVEFHASTQTFNATPEKVRFLQEAGFSRVILERNLSLGQIKDIRAATDVELEVFVHGAICVCHSGRCYMSRTMSSRSGNRGECSQPCRLTYDLLDGNMQPLITGKHLLSVQDLDLSARIGDLLDAGVSSFKIEGRLKDAAYVKNTVSFYRRRLDKEIAARKGCGRASAGTTITDFEPNLPKTFTRGRSEYFFTGKRAGVASFDTPKALGEYIGKVSSSGKDWFSIDTENRLSPGDGICFLEGGGLQGTNINKSEGGRIYPNRSAIPRPGTEIYRNYDHSFHSVLGNSRTRRVIDAAGAIEMTPDKITARFRDEEGIVADVQTAGAFPLAENPAKAEETIRTQITKSGDTIFRITGVELTAPEGERFVPVSVINSLRREGLQKLLEARLAVPPRRKPAAADCSFPYPAPEAGESENITNRLAAEFYRRHRVSSISPGLDKKEHLHGKTVMRTPYCIRRETGCCRKNDPSSNGDLFLRRGTHLYRLQFDCRECMMEIVFEDRLL